VDRELRRAVVLRAAVAVVRREGFAGMTHRSVAVEAGCGVSTVYRVANSNKKLRREVLNFSRGCGLHDILDRASNLNLS
jgi:DNA-binding transcriptional regulator YbjK